MLGNPGLENQLVPHTALLFRAPQNPLRTTESHSATTPHLHSREFRAALPTQSWKAALLTETCWIGTTNDGSPNCCPALEKPEDCRARQT